MISKDGSGRKEYLNEFIIRVIKEKYNFYKTLIVFLFTLDYYKLEIIKDIGSWNYYQKSGLPYDYYTNNIKIALVKKLIENKLIYEYKDGYGLSKLGRSIYFIIKYKQIIKTKYYKTLRNIIGYFLPVPEFLPELNNVCSWYLKNNTPLEAGDTLMGSSIRALCEDGYAKSINGDYIPTKAGLYIYNKLKFRNWIYRKLYFY